MTSPIITCNKRIFKIFYTNLSIQTTTFLQPT